MAIAGVYKTRREGDLLHKRTRALLVRLHATRFTSPPYAGVPVVIPTVAERNLLYPFFFEIFNVRRKCLRLSLIMPYCLCG